MDAIPAGLGNSLPDRGLLYLFIRVDVVNCLTLHRKLMEMFLNIADAMFTNVQGLLLCALEQ